MPTAKITKRTVDALRPSDRDVITWDEDLQGFGVLVTDGGHKSYVVQYRIPGIGRRGMAKRVTIATVGKLTPDEARKQAKRELGKVAQGSDPAADRATRRGAKTVKDFGEAYFEDIKSRHKPSTLTEYKRLWKKHVLPRIGTRAVDEVTSTELRRLHRGLADTPYLANRTAAMLGGFFTYARKEGVLSRSENPAHGIDFYQEKSRERFLTENEFKRLGNALAEAETTGLPPAPQHKRTPEKVEKANRRPKSADDPIPANPFAVAALRLLALTGCRENEILSLRWDAVDFERGYLRLADTKTGKSNRALSQSAVEVLVALPRISNNPFVLPGAKPGDHLKEIKRLWASVRHAAELNDVRLHDLRHSYASVSAVGGESMLILRSLLGHKRVATTERYAHLGDDPVKRAAEKTGGAIASWLSNRETESTD